MERINNNDVAILSRSIVEKSILSKKAKRYQVYLLNDDYTPIDFVISVLTDLFFLDMDKAKELTFQIHNNGKGICGVFNREIAETKVAQVNTYARVNQYPLLCEMEEII